MTDVPSLLPALPEIILAVGALVLLMVGVYRRPDTIRVVSSLSVVLLLIALVAVIGGAKEPTTTFEGLFVSDSFSSFAKVLILLGSALAVVMSVEFLQHQKLRRFEFPVLIVLATLGMLMMVSSNDLLSLYVSIELQSLALYVLAAFNRDSARSTEAGLKYFVLGALSSGMLLYGCSLIYGYTGATGFDAIAHALSGQETAPLGVIFGLVFLIAGLAFKVSAVPFHMWTPDVYEGAPTPVTAFFAVAPKIAAMGLFVRVMMGPFPEIAEDWQQIIVFLSIASMLIGAFAALVQTNIKRLMAYSSIGHVGYALVGLAAGSQAGVQSVLIYLTIYLAMNVGAFSIILSMRRKEGMLEGIDDLAGLSRTRPGMAMALAIFMFSLAGIPPLAGFFGKFYVFLAAIEADLIALSVIGVLASVVSAYYYLRVIKLMYFDAPTVEFDVEPGRAMKIIMAGAALFTVFFAAFPAPLRSAAEAAASAFASGEEVAWLAFLTIIT